MLYLSMIKRNIIFISSLLFILSSCDNDDIPMYFRSMQPSGGKLFEGSIKEYYLNSIPQNMYLGSKNYIFDSTDSEEQLEAQFEKYFFSDLGLKGKEFHFIPLAVLMLPIAEGADFGVQIIRGPRYIDLEIHFDKNKMINEKFEVDSLFPDSIFTEKGIAISKENIICFNKKNDNGYYHIEEIWETDRSDGVINIYEKPFFVGMPGKKTNFFDDNSRILSAPLESFDKLLGNMKEGFNLGIVDFNDSLKTYSADPDYMSFRNGLRQESFDANNKLSFLMKIYGACVEKMDEDSLRYGALLDYLNPYIK